MGFYAYLIYKKEKTFSKIDFINTKNIFKIKNKAKLYLNIPNSFSMTGKPLL